MTRASAGRWLAASIAAAAAMAPACAGGSADEAPPGGDPYAATPDAPAPGIAALFGVDAEAGLGAVGGFSTADGLATARGVSPSSGLVVNEAGRNTLAYMVRCALPAGRAIVKKDPQGKVHLFPGQLGMWPSWEWASCDGQCQEHVTACLMAHLNATAATVPLWLDSASAAIGWGRSAAYPRQEGSFFGNLFTSPPRAYYCGGSDFAAGAVSARIGAHVTGTPYRNAAPGGGCRQACVAATPPNQNDGYQTCGGFEHVMTVWRP